MLNRAPSKKVLGIIPARLNSTRMPQKLLAPIGGKPLLFYTWERAKGAKELDSLIIATDSKEIMKVAEGFGARVILTSPKIRSGSDRVAIAASKFKDFSPAIVVNIQGDEPLLPPRAIDEVVRALSRDRKSVMATPASLFLNEKDVTSPNFVKVVVGIDGEALYFSRSIVPYPRDPYKKYLKHLGLYAFRAEFLKTYVKLPQTPLEKTEKLEQLRALEWGYKIKVVVGKFPTLEVNTLAEYRKVKRLIEGDKTKLYA